MFTKPKVLLLALNFLVALAIFTLSANSFFPDQDDYIALAESILFGKFSQASLKFSIEEA